MTHYEGCWREHRECAEHRLNELQLELSRLSTEWQHTAKALGYHRRGRRTRPSNTLLREVHKERAGQLVEMGLTPKQISAIMGVARHTVCRYLNDAGYFPVPTVMWKK